MTFEQELEKMQNFYLYTDREFNELSQIIPLDNKLETYSPRFYNILQSTCGQVENICRILCEKLQLRPSKSNFASYYSELNVDGMLEKQAVYLIKKNEVKMPFKITSNKTPDWWQNYNDTKHKLPDGILQGNIGNTINALSALYSLHRIAFHVRFEANPIRVLCKKHWYESWIADARDLLTRRIMKYEPQGMFYSELFSPISFYSAEIGR